MKRRPGVGKELHPMNYEQVTPVHAESQHPLGSHAGYDLNRSNQQMAGLGLRRETDAGGELRDSRVLDLKFVVYRPTFRTVIGELMSAEEEAIFPQPPQIEVWGENRWHK